MTLRQQLTEDMKTAMRAGDKHRLGVIRLMLAAVKQREVDSPYCCIKQLEFCRTRRRAA